MKSSSYVQIFVALAPTSRPRIDSFSSTTAWNTAQTFVHRIARMHSFMAKINRLKFSQRNNTQGSYMFCNWLNKLNLKFHKVWTFSTVCVFSYKSHIRPGHARFRRIVVGEKKSSKKYASEGLGMGLLIQLPSWMAPLNTITTIHQNKFRQKKD